MQEQNIRFDEENTLSKEAVTKSREDAKVLIDKAENFMVIVVSEKGVTGIMTANREGRVSFIISLLKILDSLVKRN